MSTSTGPVPSGGVAPSSVSVVVATYCRPDVLRTCLEHLVAQTAAPLEILVVDASPDDLSRTVVDGFPTVRYQRNDEGMGTLPRSRQIGLEQTTGEVIAFLDDDAFADPNWLVDLASTYEHGIGGVGGQARNDQPDELTTGLDAIGQMRANGDVTGNFAADPGRVIEVDHLIGCNMSFRREALIGSGGIPAWPAGVSALREDLFLSLRVTRAGWRLAFNPRAGVLHIGAPQARGRRFDVRYQFNGTRNHMFVLVAHFGLRSPIVWRSAASILLSSATSFVRALVGQSLRLGTGPIAMASGIRRGVAFRRHDDRP